MNEVKFKANKKDLEAIGGQIEEATAALDTTGATAGQVLKVETPGEAPVWGEAGGEGILWVTLTQGDPATCDKTHAEIINAMGTGRVIGKLGPSSKISGASYLPFPTPDAPVKFHFLDITDDDKLRLTVASVDGNDTVTISAYTYPLQSA